MAGATSTPVGNAVEDEAAGLLFEDRDQVAMRGEIVFAAKDGCGEMTIKRLGHAQIIGRRRAVNKQRVGAEELFGEGRLAQEGFEGGFKELRVRGAGWIGGGCGCLGDGSSLRGAVSRGAGIGVGDACGEQRERARTG